MLVQLHKRHRPQWRQPNSIQRKHNSFVAVKEHNILTIFVCIVLIQKKKCVLSWNQNTIVLRLSLYQSLALLSPSQIQHYLYITSPPLPPELYNNSISNKQKKITIYGNTCFPHFWTFYSISIYFIMNNQTQKNYHNVLVKHQKIH